MYPVINNVLMGLNEVGGVFFDYAAGVFIQSALLVILLFAIDLLLRKRVRAVFRYCVWLLVLVKLILPPMLSLPTGIGYWVGNHLPAAPGVSNMAFDSVALQDAGPSGEMPQVRHDENIAGDDPGMALADSTLTALTWQAVVFLLWLAGVLAFLAVLVQRIRFVKGLVAASCPAGDELTGLLEQCRRQMAIRRDIKLRLSEAIPSPAVCGLLRPTVLMPASLAEKLSPEGLRATLIHELAHIKRGDLWINSVQTFLQVVYFYNPFVWFANSIIRKVCEEAVDETVLVALGGEAEHYSNTLIDIGEIVFWKADLGLRLIGVAESKKALQWRIKHMLNRPIPKSSKLGALGIIMLLIIAAILLPMAKAQKSEVTNEPVASDHESKLNGSLLQAAKDGDIEKVRSLIAAGANINARDNEGTTTLIFAIMSDHRDVVEFLLAKGADVNVKNKWHCAPMIHAVWNRNVDIIKLLLDNGADVNTTKTAFDAPGVSTPLHEAIYGGSLDIVRLLIDNGADINAVGEFGWTPLQNAVVHGNRYQIELLLDEGATGPVFHVATCKGDLAEVKRLLAKGMHVDEKDEHGCTPLYWSVATGRKEMVEFLLTSGADVNMKNEFGDVPLHRALGKRIKPNKDIVKLLIAKGTDINMKNGWPRETALHIAARGGHKEIVELLLANGANVNLKNRWNAAALHIAAGGGYREMVEVIIAAGAEINAKDQDGQSPLHRAAHNGHMPIVELLLIKGADVNAKDNDGRSALSLAQEKGRTEVVDLLKKHGAKEEPTASSDQSEQMKSLHEAAADGDIEQVKLLISKGADVNSKNEAGQTPLGIAISQNRKEIVDLLSKHGADVSLHTAARLGLLERIKDLIGKGIDINAKDNKGASPLHIAVWDERKEVVELLLAEGADVNTKDKSGFTPLQHAIWDWDYDRELIPLLINHGGKVPETEYPPIYYAVWNEDLDIVKLLIAKGARFDVKAVRNNKTAFKTAFHCALDQGSRAIVEFFLGKSIDIPKLYISVALGDVEGVKDLIEKGADVNTHDELGCTPLYWAASMGRTEVAKFLMDKGADFRNAATDNRTVLYQAAQAGDCELVELLLSKGANIHAVNTRKQGRTPLYRAAQRSQIDMVKLLITAGANINASAKFDRTALHAVAARGQKDIATLLINEGADMNCRDVYGLTPLHTAAREGQRDIADLLLSKGVDVNAKNKDNRTPLDIAIGRGHTEIVELFKKHGAKE